MYCIDLQLYIVFFCIEFHEYNLIWKKLFYLVH